MATPTTQPGPASGGTPTPNNTDTQLGAKVLSRRGLQELVKGVDPNEQLDEEVEELLLNYAEEYMEAVMEGACSLALHRKGNQVEVKDVQTHLERVCNIWIPGFGTEELKPYKRAPVTEAHKQRMALIKKTLKKY